MRVYASMHACLPSTTGPLPLHEPLSLHHIPPGPTATGLQSVPDHGTSSSTRHTRLWNRKPLRTNSGLVLFISAFYSLSSKIKWLLRTSALLRVSFFVLLQIRASLHLFSLRRDNCKIRRGDSDCATYNMYMYCRPCLVTCIHVYHLHKLCLKCEPLY